MHSKTRTITYCALLIAISVILKAYLKVSFGDFLIISLAPIAVMFAGVIMGPVCGGIVGACADALSAIISPIGAYFPGYTLTMAIYGIIPGLLIKKTPASLPRTALTVALTQLICSFLLNNIWLSIMTGLSMEVLTIRLISSAISLGVYAAALYLLGRFVKVNLRQARAA